MSASWLERLTGPRTPAGYRPGVTLGHLQRNLGLGDFTCLERGLARFTYRKDGPVLEVSERTESHLLMHLVMCQFSLRVPTRQTGALRLEVRHSGLVRRTGLVCRLRDGDRARFEAFEYRLSTDATLRSALMPLDFKRLALECHSGQWHVTLEHMGGSEVVNRMPAFRRYIPLGTDQRSHLWRAFDALEQALRDS